MKFIRPKTLVHHLVGPFEFECEFGPTSLSLGLRGINKSFNWSDTQSNESTFYPYFILGEVSQRDWIDQTVSWILSRMDRV